ncbi:MAG: ribosomal protein [Bacteroidetes bacterium]|nr:ribosomal protein [Bacteroidota bacterium]
MSEVVLNAEIRDQLGKSAKRSRNEGNVPGVFYAHGEKNINLKVPAVSLAPLVFGSETRIIDLRLNDGTAKKAILRDVQFDPVSDRPIHFDLQGLHADEKVTIEVPVVLTGGVPVGVRNGGLLQHSIHKVRVSCLPKDIPGKIEIDVANLEMNRSVHVRELNVPNVTILENMDAAVVGIIPPTIEKEPEPTAAAVEELKEPEVVGKGKKAEEGEEGAEATPAKTEAKPAKDAKEAKETKEEKKK